ncbi:MFS transporter [Paenibacillus alkalitolerans]|uniref:MFS transporter n=1 Tax=Paenibacillus alkalitolerans TaxID=2799335 RepID=UPI0018F6C979|nr:MFS transporter [Paenibacillus alkalitolerans]
MSFTRLVYPGMAMIAVCYGLARFGYGLLLPEFSRDLGLDKATSGWIASGSYFFYCVAILLAIRFTPRLGPRRVIAAAGFSAFVGMLLMALSQNPIWFAAGVWTAGASTGLASPPYATVVSGRITKGLQDRANTWINSGTGLGIILSGPAALLLAGYWRTAYLVFALIALLVLCWNTAVIPPGGREEETESKGSSLLRKGIAPMFSASIIIGISSASYWTFSRGYLVQESSYSGFVTSTFWMIIGIAGIIGGIAGKVIEGIGLARSYRFGVVSLALSILLLPVFLSRIFPVFLSGALFGASYVYLTGVLLVWGIRVYPDRTVAGIGVPFLLLALGQMIGSQLAGMVAQAFNYPAMFILFAIVGATGLFIKDSAEKRKKQTCRNGESAKRD